MKKYLGLALAVAGLTWNSAATIYNYSWSGIGQAIPDANPSGYVNSQTISEAIQGNPSFPANPYISGSVTVDLTISGGWNGDLYAYLRHETAGGVGFTVLLNRVGTSGGNPIGYTDAGFNNITLTDVANPDIHTYGGGGVPTGTYHVDTTTLPASSTTFSSFQGLDPNGTWSLFVADLSGNHVSQLDAWGLHLEVVPEPVNAALGIFGGLIGTVALVRRYVAARRALQLKPVVQTADRR